jgi:hypothetical protein
MNKVNIIVADVSGSEQRMGMILNATQWLQRDDPAGWLPWLSLRALLANFLRRLSKL